MRANVIVLYFCIVCVIVNGAHIGNDLLELSIIHLNDFHARFEETNLNSGPCKDQICIGGFSRLHNKVHELVNDRTNAVFLNAGDNFQGTIWYNAFRWNVTQYFMNKLPTDVYTLGNHEFDNGIRGVIPFIEALNAPTVVANIIDTYEPEIQGTYKKSTIIERDGKKIGIIGVIAKNTNELSSTEKLVFTNEVEAVNREAAILRENENCKIIIVLSHCGLDVDVEMAKTLGANVNLIVGGHSHTLLYNGQPPNNEISRGPYPVIVERENDRKILIVQASAYTKFLGNLTVWYDHNGDIQNWEGNPIYLDSSIPEDPEINRELKLWKESIEAFSNKVIGSSNVELSKNDCHHAECNLGNFLTDATVDHFISKAEPDTWTYASVSIMNSGGIRTTIPKGNITYGDLLTTSPFESTIDVGELLGSQIKDFLEYSVDDSQYATSFKQFLQISGMRVVFNLTKPIGNRVVSLEIQCRKCNIPILEKYQPDQMYRIVLPSFLANGGDGYSMIRDNLQNYIKGDTLDIEVFENYLQKVSPVTTGIEGRITLV